MDPVPGCPPPPVVRTVTPAGMPLLSPRAQRPDLTTLAHGRLGQPVTVDLMTDLLRYDYAPALIAKLTHLFQQADADRDRSLGRAEVAQLLRGMYEATGLGAPSDESLAEEVDTLFLAHDWDNSGSLDVVEVCELLRMAGVTHSMRDRWRPRVQLPRIAVSRRQEAAAAAQVARERAESIRERRRKAEQGLVTAVAYEARTRDYQCGRETRAREALLLERAEGAERILDVRKRRAQLLLLLQRAESSARGAVYAAARRGAVRMRRAVAAQAAGSAASRLRKAAAAVAASGGRADCAPAMRDAESLFASVAGAVWRGGGGVTIASVLEAAGTASRLRREADESAQEAPGGRSAASPHRHRGGRTAGAGGEADAGGDHSGADSLLEAEPAAAAAVQRGGSAAAALHKAEGLGGLVVDAYRSSHPAKAAPRGMLAEIAENTGTPLHAVVALSAQLWQRLSRRLPDVPLPYIMALWLWCTPKAGVDAALGLQGTDSAASSAFQTEVREAIAAAAGAADAAAAASAAGALRRWAGSLCVLLAACSAPPLAPSCGDGAVLWVAVPRDFLQLPPGTCISLSPLTGCIAGRADEKAPTVTGGAVLRLRGAPAADLRCFVPGTTVRRCLLGPSAVVYITALNREAGVVHAAYAGSLGDGGVGRTGFSFAADSAFAAALREAEAAAAEEGAVAEALTAVLTHHDLDEMPYLYASGRRKIQHEERKTIIAAISEAVRTLPAAADQRAERHLAGCWRYASDVQLLMAIGKSEEATTAEIRALCNAVQHELQQPKSPRR